MPIACAAMPMRPPSRLDKRDTVALALFAEPEAGGDAHGVEGDLAGIGGMKAELVLDAHDLVAGRVGRHDEGGDALLAGVGIGDGKDDDRRGRSCPR